MLDQAMIPHVALGHGREFNIGTPTHLGQVDRGWRHHGDIQPKTVHCRTTTTTQCGSCRGDRRVSGRGSLGSDSASLLACVRRRGGFLDPRTDSKLAWVAFARNRSTQSGVWVQCVHGTRTYYSKLSH